MGFETKVMHFTSSSDPGISYGDINGRGTKKTIQTHKNTKSLVPLQNLDWEPHQ
jgi:hypothetical protein